MFLLFLQTASYSQPPDPIYEPIDYSSHRVSITENDKKDYILLDIEDMSRPFGIEVGKTKLEEANKLLINDWEHKLKSENIKISYKHITAPINGYRLLFESSKYDNNSILLEIDDMEVVQGITLMTSEFDTFDKFFERLSENFDKNVKPQPSTYSHTFFSSFLSKYDNVMHTVISDNIAHYQNEKTQLLINHYLTGDVNIEATKRTLLTNDEEKALINYGRVEFLAKDKEEINWQDEIYEFVHFSIVSDEFIKAHDRVIVEAINEIKDDIEREYLLSELNTK